MARDAIASSSNARRTSSGIFGTGGKPIVPKGRPAAMDPVGKTRGRLKAALRRA
jgi:hypothetical protein